MFNIAVTVHTPVGVFNGMLSKTDAPTNNGLQQMIDRIQSLALNSLVIYQQGPAGETEEVHFRESVLDDSVVSLRITERG